MVRQKRDRPIDSKRKIHWGKIWANYQNGHDNEVSALKEHYDITLNKALTKVQVPENDEKWRDLDKLCRIGIESNDRRRYLWYEVALNAINGYDDLKFKLVI